MCLLNVFGKEYEIDILPDIMEKAIYKKCIKIRQINDTFLQFNSPKNHRQSYTVAFLTFPSEITDKWLRHI